ncbi:flagellin [Thalassomonas viridans]|uniref:Flagellin n=1 Tax=Thalassomonas viridans TaxID=137584 RepID=A0AAF0C9C7_9GAMM|nr:flagellin [Thalassomonas viridans]WDE05638.1 flagellin [Thalassomonas viridans]
MDFSVKQTSANLSFIERINQERQEAREQLASGKRINSAADDPAGLQISNRLTSGINAFEQLATNARDQVNINQVQSSQLNAINDNLQRANVLAIQSGNPLYQGDAIQGELDQITAEINVIAGEALGQDDFLQRLDATDPATTQAALEAARANISDRASDLGADSNALLSQAATYDISRVSLSDSRSRIEDADFARVTGEQEQADTRLQIALLNKRDEESRKGLLIDQLL